MAQDRGTRDLRERRRRLDAVRSRFDTGHLDVGGIAPEVGDSWRRCIRTLPTARTASVALEDPDATWAASPIRSAASDVVDELARLAISEDYVAAITDGAGHIIWSAAGRSMATLAEQVNFVRGANWQEMAAGTNAPGLALHTGRPATVFATEHWCEAVQDWVCYAAPVRDPSGRLLGVLDLSAVWRRASPLALTTVTAMSRLVEQQLLASPRARTELRLSVLGHPRVEMNGAPVRVSQRQLEILTILAVRREAGAEVLQDLLYGERPISSATLKAEISHLRQLLGGAIDSRPYRLALTVDADVIDALGALRAGDVEGALRLYRGPLLPMSESPYLTDLRHHLDVSLRAALLRDGQTDQLLRFADLHPTDRALLEHARAVTRTEHPLYSDLVARLAAVPG